MSAQGSSPVWAVRAYAGQRGVSLWEIVQYELSESQQDGESFNVGEAWCGVRRGPCRWKAHCEVFKSKRSKGNRDVWGGLASGVKA